MRHVRLRQKTRSGQPKRLTSMPVFIGLVSALSLMVPSAAMASADNASQDSSSQTVDSSNSSQSDTTQKSDKSDKKAKSDKKDKTPKKVFVCKYVGTPGTNERLQTGNNPISVSINAIDHNTWDGSVPGWFSDQHDRSYVLAYDTGQRKPSVSSCPDPTPDTPPEPVVDHPTGTATFSAATCEVPFNHILTDVVPGGIFVLTDTEGSTFTTTEGVAYEFLSSTKLPGDLAFGAVTVELQDADDSDDHEVAPWSGTWLTVDPASLQCNTEPDPEPTVTPDPEPEPECVDANWSYTFDGVASGTVTASSRHAHEGDKVCNPLAVRAITYTYDRPTSGSPSWPQTKAGYNDVLVDTIGTFAYVAPEPNQCVQHDIAAQFVKKGGFDALTVADKLYGPSNPFEPPFLHDTLSGKGPNPTWSYTSNQGCDTPPEPVVDHPTGTATFSAATCEVPFNHILTDAVPGGIFVLTDTEGSTFTTTEGVAYEFLSSTKLPGDLAFGAVTVELQDADDSDDHEVAPWSGTWLTVDPASLQCNTEPDPEPTVTPDPEPEPTDTPTVTPTPEPTDTPSETPKPEPTPTDTPTVQPTPTTAPVPHPSPSSSAKPTPPALASTGTNAWLSGVLAMLLIVVGGAGIGLARRMRHQS